MQLALSDHYADNDHQGVQLIDIAGTIALPTTNGAYVESPGWTTATVNWPFESGKRMEPEVCCELRQGQVTHGMVIEFRLVPVAGIMQYAPLFTPKLVVSKAFSPVGAGFMGATVGGKGHLGGTVSGAGFLGSYTDGAGAFKPEDN